MRRPEELVDRRHARQTVAAVDQDPQVARQRHRIARHRSDRGTCERGQLLDCSAAPARGGSNTTPSKCGKLLGAQRPAEGRAARWSRASALARRVAPRVQRRQCRRVAFHRMHLALPRQAAAQRCREPENRSATLRPVPDGRHQLGHRCFGRFGRLQEAAGRRGDRTPPKSTVGFRGSSTISPSIDSRAKSCGQVNAAAAVRRALVRSLPRSVGRDVQACSRHGDGHAGTASGVARAVRPIGAGDRSAATIAGTAIGHSTMSTISCDSARL